MPRLRRFLQVLALVCLVLFLLPGYAYDVRPERSIMSIKLGVPSSPWAHLELEHEKTASGEKNSTTWGVQILSWSLLVAVVGILANWVAKLLREKEPDAATAISTSNAFTDKN